MYKYYTIESRGYSKIEKDSYTIRKVIRKAYSKNKYKKWASMWSSNLADLLPEGAIKLPKGSIKKLIGRDLSWEDACRIKGGITMYVARDKDKRLWLYDTKPIKGDTGWVIANTTGGCCRIDDGNLDGFEDVKWEDEEPRELVLK